MANEKEATDWLAVAARAAALTSLHQAGLADASMVAKAEFLMNLGIARVDAATMIGSNPESLRVQLAQKKKKKESGA